MIEDELTEQIIGAAIEVHKHWGAWSLRRNGSSPESVGRRGDLPQRHGGTEENNGTGDSIKSEIDGTPISDLMERSILGRKTRV